MTTLCYHMVTAVFHVVTLNHSLLLRFMRKDVLDTYVNLWDIGNVKHVI